MGKNACSGSIRTRVCIPRTHIKSHHVLVRPSAGGNGQRQETAGVCWLLT